MTGILLPCVHPASAHFAADAPYMPKPKQTGNTKLQKREVETKVELNVEALDAVRVAAEKLFGFITDSIKAGGYQKDHAPIIEFSKALSRAMLAADRLGWARLQQDAMSSGDVILPAPKRFLALAEFQKFAAEDLGALPPPQDIEAWLDLPWEDAAESIAEREPELAYGFRKAAAAYERKAFAVARATTIDITKAVQKKLADTLTQRNQQEADYRRRVHEGGGKAAGAKPKPFNLVKELQAIDPVSFSLSYVKTVARTNLASAYSAGRDQAMQEAAVTGQVSGAEFLSARLPSTRPNHSAGHEWVGLLGSTVWNGHTPPLGYNCFCSKRAIFRVEAKRRGLLQENGRLVVIPVPSGWRADQGGPRFGFPTGKDVYR